MQNAGENGEPRDSFEDTEQRLQSWQCGAALLQRPRPGRSLRTMVDPVCWAPICIWLIFPNRLERDPASRPLPPPSSPLRAPSTALCNYWDNQPLYEDSIFWLIEIMRDHGVPGRHAPGSEIKVEFCNCYNNYSESNSGYRKIRSSSAWLLSYGIRKYSRQYSNPHMLQMEKLGIRKVS